MRRRRSIIISAPLRLGSVLRAARAPAAALLFLACACETAPPLRPEIGHVLINPDTYHDKRVEFSGRVIDYEPATGDEYRALRFTIGVGPSKKIPVYGGGYGADAIAKASDLVGEAYRSDETLTVVGKLKAAGGNGPAELRLESVGFEGRKIDLRRGRKTRPGFEVGGFHITPSIGVSATFTP